MEIWISIQGDPGESIFRVALPEKEDGVLEGVALPRVVRDEAHLAAIFAGAPPWRVSAAGGSHH